MIESLIKYALSFGVISASLTYIVKIIIDKFAEISATRYKQNIEQDLEKFKLQLNIYEFENNTKFNHLYLKKALIFEELFELIIEIERFYKNILHPFSGFPINHDENVINLIETKHHDFSEYFNKKSLYFNEDMIDLLINFEKKSIKLLNELDYFTSIYSNKEISLTNEDRVNIKKLRDDVFFNELQDLKNNISNEFKKILENTK